ncbi:MAG: DUF302 domain-containing protein [Acidimicrobiales bacterium]
MDHLRCQIDQPLADVESRVRAALAAEGFGILSEIDVAATLRAKLGVERAPLRVLGACNPALINEALAREPDVALALPCNVVLEALSETTTQVTIADPAQLMSDPRLADLVADARQHLGRALDEIAS